MDGYGRNSSDTQGTEDDHGFTGTESGSVALTNNVTEGSSATVGDEMMQDSQSEIDQPDVNFKTGTSQSNDGGNGSPTLMSTQNSSNSVVSDCGSSALMSPGFNTRRASDLLMAVSLCAELTRTKINDLAYSSMDELLKISIAGKPLWEPQKDQKYETMNEYEYLRKFGDVEETLRQIVKMVEVGEPRSLPSFDSPQIEYDATPKVTPKEDTRIESSRDMECIKINPIKLVELLMDPIQWSRAFYNLVARAALLGTLSNGVEGSYDGKLQVMIAEFHLPTPLVATRKCYFARYCKKLSPEMWGVVDISLEKFFPYPPTNFRRRPSGCLIKEMPNGYSEVTWIEHVEADYSLVNVQFKPLVSSGFAFSATRWLASLVRSCECSETLKEGTTPTDDGVLIPQAGKTSLLNLAERMMRSFAADISASTANPWMQLIASFSGSEDLRIMIQNSIMEDPGKPRGTTVVFATSVWLPASPKRLFNFLRDEKSRNKWDFLSRGFAIRELFYVIKGKDPRNRVSIMQLNTSQSQTGSFYVQESYTDKTGSYVVYAPVDTVPLSDVLNGGNPDNVPLLSSGFAILPDGMSGNDGENGFTGSLLTVAFHIVEIVSNKSFIPPESVVSFNKIISATIIAIKDAVLNKNP